ncbi:hypothetical protein F4821DRAFT_55195 [Hypoxylon rubiginosum]|uniref:Uncharacterized protein n=1 Tax=Hypoxylon rubiginosum TaxID=110542 RepID=A0ACC0CJF3_9PEZI|nr:hypothetical protein F4821DRAFT_55195 [Hypoxylon rubiginosum]
MSSATEFPLFPRLPKELRLDIWELSILSHNRDRLVPINEETKRVICMTSIANCPLFRVSPESREVSQKLYPIRLPVFWKVYLRKIGPELSHNSHLEGYRATDENMEDNAEECRGCIYISTTHDTFIFGFDRLAPSHFDEYWWTTGPIGGPHNFGWRSASLTQLQCLEVRRIMVINGVNSSWRENGCRNTLRCAVRCGALDEKVWHDAGAFPGVEECIYLPLEGDAYVDSVYLYAYMLVRPGHRVLARLRRGNHLVFFDKEQIREARNKSPVCVCNDEEVCERIVTW